MTVFKIITSEQMSQYRAQLADNSEALNALDVIDECEGNLEDAMILMAMRETGTEPDRGFNLEEMSEKYRPAICSQSFRSLVDIINILTGLLGTIGVAVALSIYIINKFGIENYCKDFEPKA